jgi:hypothetical protein
MKSAVYCALICVVIGFAVAAYVLTADPSRISTTIAYIVCPPVILAGLMVSDPTAASLLMLLGPLNGLLYGAVGFTLWLLVIGDSDDSVASENEPSDRPLGL